MAFIVLFSMSLFGADYEFCSADNFLEGDSIAKRGCCSHHKGVCGCKNGRAECCDGTLSPSCGCD